MSEQNPYEVLGIPQGSDAQTIRRAYLKRARETHPDTGGDAAAFDAVVAAWRVLAGSSDDGGRDSSAAPTWGSVVGEEPRSEPVASPGAEWWYDGESEQDVVGVDPLTDPPLDLPDLGGSAAGIVGVRPRPKANEAVAGAITVTIVGGLLLPDMVGSHFFLWRQILAAIVIIPTILALRHMPARPATYPWRSGPALFIAWYTEVLLLSIVVLDVGNPWRSRGLVVGLLGAVALILDQVVVRCRAFTGHGSAAIEAAGRWNVLLTRRLWYLPNARIVPQRRWGVAGWALIPPGERRAAWAPERARRAWVDVASSTPTSAWSAR